MRPSAKPKQRGRAAARVSRAQAVAQPASREPSPSVKAAVCPADMQFVDAVHCPDLRHQRPRRRCLKRDRNRPNNLSICQEFEGPQRCPHARRRQRFCIDRYEFPNQPGAHPPVMVSAYDAAELCRERGKRLCFKSEWTAACEGPKLLPFPYGYKRSKKMCNIDNRWIYPKLKLVHARRNAVRGPELLRLDQSVASGSMPGCESGYGVHDLTGNFDEWVRTEWPQGKGRWAGLKGGAWGHVRNACRPMTTSHVAHWSYYFISFRCCKTPPTSRLPALPDDGIPTWLPPSDAPPRRPAGRLDRGYPPTAPAKASATKP